MSKGSDRFSSDSEMVRRALKEREIFQDAIRYSPVPFAVYDEQDRLIAWNPSYENNHPTAFEVHRERANAGELTYRDLMRFQTDPALNAQEAADALDRRVKKAWEKDGPPQIQEYPTTGHYMIYRYWLPSGARAGIAMNVSDLIETQRELTEARIEAEDNARKLAEASAEIQSFAFSDELTGLPNRRMLAETLRILQERPERGNQNFVLLHIDLDRFKQVNDVFGHAAGDFVLRRVSSLLLEHCRPGDLAVRLGGDEFVLLMVDDCDSELGENVARKIIDALSTPIYYNSCACRIGASIGVSAHHYNEIKLDFILSRSDLAMYKAKARGRNRV